jgi:hypothetical protein
MSDLRKYACHEMGCRAVTSFSPFSTPRWCAHDEELCDCGLGDAIRREMRRQALLMVLVVLSLAVYGLCALVKAGQIVWGRA